MNRALSRPFIIAPAKDRFHNAVLRSINDLTDQVNSLVNTGATLKSGPSLTLTNRIHHVSGTAAIKNIVVPSGVGGDIILVPDAAWTTVTGGNIGAAFTATANVPVHAVFDGSKWWFK